MDLRWSPMFHPNQPLKAVPYSESSLNSDFAQYKTFSLTGFTGNYGINVSGYTGTLKDVFNGSTGMAFQTYGRNGGWWGVDRIGFNAHWTDSDYFQVSEIKVRPHA